MSSLGLAVDLAAGAGDDELMRLVGLHCRRLADVLGTLSSSDDSPAAGGRRLLLSVAESTDGDDEPPRIHPIERLIAALRLTPLEVSLVVLAGLPEVHEGIAGILRMLHPRGEPAATTGLAAQLLAETPPARHQLRELLETGAAVRAGALALGEDGPFFERSLVLPDRLWSALAGVDAWPASTRRVVPPLVIDGLGDWLAQPAARLAAAALAEPEQRTILLLADSEDVALQRAAALARCAGVTAVAVMPPAISPDVEHLIGVHAIVRGAVPLVAVPVVEPPAEPHAIAFDDYPGPIAVAARTGSVLIRGSRPLLTIQVERLTPPARRALWAAALPELADDGATLAARHAVEPAVVTATATDVRSLQRLHGRRLRVDDVSSSVRARAGLLLASGVKLVHPTAGWDQLVLSEESVAQLREAVDRLRHQSTVLDDWHFLEGRPGARGVRMLFSGPPGTGKTLSAEVLAHDLGVDLLSVDISRVVSKWIGETEKNLSAVFDAAERAEAALLIDEADALFGKRTEVSDAHDRYANLETSYLLARLERFEGLAILSTNLRQNIDPAFTRRLEYIVDFEEPGVAERTELWRCHLPARAPLDASVQVEELAELYPIVGAMIRNAAVAAGFLAAADGGRITRSHLVRTIRREYVKSGRAFPGVPVGTTA